METDSEAPDSICRNWFSSAKSEAIHVRLFPCQVWTDMNIQRAGRRAGAADTPGGGGSRSSGGSRRAHGGGAAERSGAGAGSRKRELLLPAEAGEAASGSRVALTAAPPPPAPAHLAPAAAPQRRQGRRGARSISRTTDTSVGGFSGAAISEQTTVCSRRKSGFHCFERVETCAAALLKQVSSCFATLNCVPPLDKKTRHELAFCVLVYEPFCHFLKELK